MNLSTDGIRNVAITGHGSTGKTTLVEQILAVGGKIPKPEAVESGKTVSDFTDEEASRGISIHTALTHLDWKGAKINLLDAPGSGDFVGEVIPALRAAESALLVVAAEAGVQIGTIQTWRRLTEREMPAVVFVNKMDKDHADFWKAVKDLKENFQSNFVPVAIPIGAAGGFKGIVDLIQKKAFLDGNPMDIPKEMEGQVDEQRQALIEAAAEGDDALMEKFFDSETLSDDEILEGIRKGMLSRKLVPVFCGAAVANAGVTAVLDAVVSFCPSPAGKPEPVAGEGGGNRDITAEGGASAFVFKTSIDQFSGRLSFVKVVTGVIRGDSELLNPRENKREKVTKAYTCQGKKLEETDALVAGDIGILNKMASVHTNDTLCSPDQAVVYLPLQLPRPVHAVAINAVSKKDEDKMNQMLQRAAEEDLTFQINYNKETKETVISGMGELHLDIILEKIRTQAKIEMNTRVPRVAYRETVRKEAGAEYQHKKQTGGHGQYAKVVLEIKPLARGEQFNFVNGVVGGRISKGYIPGVEKGVIEGMEAGILAGYPVVDLEAKVVDGKEHPVDSSELSFKLAARGALRASMEKADPVLLEPVMDLTVFVDDQYLGDVLSDLSSRRGRVLGQEPVGGGIQEVKAQVPQAELLRYSIDLRSITSGTAGFEMEFSHYSPITGKISDQVVAAAEALKQEGS